MSNSGNVDADEHERQLAEDLRTRAGLEGVLDGIRRIVPA
jgi:hypothetical protein